ncbi:MAG: metalloregulator ArsR/SmtB family transcription factor [Phycisphaerae bacterium]
MAKQKRPNASTLKEWAQGFSLLSDKTRLGILAELSKGPSNVGGLCKALKLKQPTISHHLGLLRMGRLVNGQRQGKSVIYTADKKALKELQAAVGKLTP